MDKASLSRLKLLLISLGIEKGHEMTFRAKKSRLSSEVQESEVHDLLNRHPFHQHLSEFERPHACKSLLPDSLRGPLWRLACQSACCWPARGPPARCGASPGSQTDVMICGCALRPLPALSQSRPPMPSSPLAFSADKQPCWFAETANMGDSKLCAPGFSWKAPGPATKSGLQGQK